MMATGVYRGGFPSSLVLLADRLDRLSALSDDDRTAILALPFSTRTVAAREYIIREGDEVDQSCLLQSGFAARHKIVANGARQIVSVHMTGDMVNLQNSLLRLADHSVEALTKAVVSFIPGAAIIDLAAARPAVALAMWMDTLIDGSIFREWVANVGRRDAATRTAHVLCEFGLRQEWSGLGSRGRFELPMTQQELADALGLTPVHVNRTLMALEAADLIHRDRRAVTIADWDRLCAAGDFDPAYLHVVDPETEGSSERG
jgi:CRP-like cAMP-binding protein